MEVAVSTGKVTGGRTLSSADWIAAALEVMVEHGLGAVAVEPLALRLGATKGSFYHHFPNRDALIVAALEHWELAQTEAVIERLALLPDPAERLRAVMAAALADRDGGLRDAAVLASATHPLVKPFVERVTDRRLAYITQTYAQLGLPQARARRRALLLYSSYVGLYECLRVGVEHLDDAELRAYAAELLTTLVPSSSDREAPRRRR
jgi:AcrR family transcriptional regulator